MIYVCEFCSEEYNDEWLLVAHKELTHEVNRVSVIQYAPPQAASTRLVAEAFEGRVVRHYRIQNRNTRTPNIFLDDVKTNIIEILRKERLRLNFIKFGIVLETRFTNVQNQFALRCFVTKNRILLETSDLGSVVDEVILELNERISEHEGKGSGWSLFGIVSLDIRIHKHGIGDRGSSYIPLPKKIQDTKSCINVQNSDNECFKYAMLTKFLTHADNATRPSLKYKNLRHKYNFNGLCYPVAVNHIERFERQNPGVSVNVFGIEKTDIVYPIKVVKQELNDHTDLLLLKNDDTSHFVYIKDFNKLVVSQVTKMKTAVTVCKRCFGFTRKPGTQAGRLWYAEHTRICGQMKPVRTVYPSGSKATIKFEKTSHQYRIPVVVYADFESCLIPVVDTDADNGISRVKYQKHVPNSYCLIVKSTLSTEHLSSYGLSDSLKLYRGDLAAKHFVDDLYEISKKVENLYSNVVPMDSLTDEEITSHAAATLCYLCEESFTSMSMKVRDHDHLTGLYRGAACSKCNLNYKIPRFIPVVLHNLSGYDAHFIVPELGRDDGKIDVLATSTEKFISFSKKVGNIKLRFIDSYRFTSSSLQQLVNNLSEDNLTETKKIVANDKISLINRKGVMPYDYIDSPARFEEKQLPPREAFFSKLNETEVSIDDYEHACRVWKELNMQTLGEYNDFYLSLDTSLLCDVMEHFRNTCINSYKLDPFHSYTAPGLAWQAMLKQTKCHLELLQDIDMIHLVESAVRGGLTQAITRHVAANNKYLPNYDATRQSEYIGYFDANNLYGWAMSTPLPYGDFKWIDPASLGDVLQLSKHGNVGYIMECDLECPDHLHDFFLDLPLLPKSMVPPGGSFPKLMTTLENRERYIAHFWIVQQAVELGYRLTKIHRVLQFSQSLWLKSYITANTTRRANATCSFQKDFFKLMNNSIYGKFLECKKKHKNVQLVTNSKSLLKLVQKPNFNTSIIINESLVLVCMDKTVVCMDRPLYVGMCILDISKTLMYDFHYKKMVDFYGRKQIDILYMDTDAFLYRIKTNDMYEDLRSFPHAVDFDFSEYPRCHPNYDGAVNKKVIGKFKDETNGIPIQEYVGLKSKVYAMKTAPIVTTTREVGEEQGVTKKAKGVKTYYVKQNLLFEHYKKCLFNNESFEARFNSIRSFKHQLYSITERKSCLTSSDDKRHITQDGIHTLPYGHYSLRRIDQYNSGISWK